MRLYLFAIIPLALSIVALFLSVTQPGFQGYLTIGVAGATALVSSAILFTYSRRSAEAKQIPLENFSLWADIGEPAAQLRYLNRGDTATAARIAATDLDSLTANAELLGSRIYLLTGRVGFEGLLAEKIHRRVDNLASDISAVTRKLNSEGFTQEIVPMLESCAAQADRIANKLFNYKSGKAEIVGLYVEPLRRAAEKLSRDLRLASANISNFLYGITKAELPVTKAKLQATQAPEAQPAPQAVPGPEVRAGSEVETKPVTQGTPEQKA